jgi:predicted phosphate transport protein (TIGR00153 family)
MKFRLLPTDEGFFGLFEDAATNVADCARKLAALLADPGDRALFEAVVACEQKGDEITRAVLSRLDTSFVTPFDREDIHALAEELDDIVDDMQAVATRIEVLSISTTLDHLREQSDLLIRLGDECVALIGGLQSMKGLAPHLDAIDKLESEGDRLYHKALGHLFSGELEALDVIRWKDLIEAMEAAINTFEDISDVVESIVLKHA